MKKKLIIALVIILLLAIVGGVIYWEINHGNRRLVDTKNRFDRAVIGLPNGDVIDGKVSSWLDYADSDVVQVTIDGKTYLTSYANVVLIDD
ncbi:MAG: hypothetical protein IJJ23_11735 [Clostridia bacterium]|nr:hypothetical protein [Clostridia bacterium]